MSKTSGQEIPGSKARMISRTLKAVNAKEWIFKQLLKRPGQMKNPVTAKRLCKKLKTEEYLIEGSYMLTATPPGFNGKHILFLHGGAYVAEASSGHRKVMEILALEYGFRITFLAYPLAPENDALRCHEVLRLAWNRINEACPGDTYLLLGDSAGGGLALSFLQRLRDDKSYRLPNKTVLVSPWLDVTMTNPAIEGQVMTEVVLDLERLKKCGALFARDLDLKDPLVSPMYGSLDHLGEILVFVSIQELFYPDVLRFEEHVNKAKGTSVIVSAWPQMPHDWIVLPVPERRTTLGQIASFFNSET